MHRLKIENRCPIEIESLFWVVSERSGRRSCSLLSTTVKMLVEAPLMCPKFRWKHSVPVAVRVVGSKVPACRAESLYSLHSHSLPPGSLTPSCFFCLFSFLFCCGKHLRNRGHDTQILRTVSQKYHSAVFPHSPLKISCETLVQSVSMARMRCVC